MYNVSFEMRKIIIFNNVQVCENILQKREGGKAKM